MALMPILSVWLLAIGLLTTTGVVQCRQFERSFKNSKLSVHRAESGVFQVDLNVTDDHVKFWAVGDWGGIPVYPYRTLVEQNIADYMAKQSAHLKTHFQVALGDNFYFLGIKDEYDKRFKVSSQQRQAQRNLLSETSEFIFVGLGYFRGRFQERTFGHAVVHGAR